MLLKISKKRDDGPVDLVDLLLECHKRIRHFVALAREVGVRWETSDEETVEACTSVERYFIEALPLHVADEEQSILPRLRGSSLDLDQALTTMAEEHTRHASKLEALLRAANAVRNMPRDSDMRQALAKAAMDLEREFAEHLALEESAIFPAIHRLLDEEATTAIIRELRQRREALP